MKISFAILALVCFAATGRLTAQIQWHDIAPDTTCGPGHPTSSFTVNVPGQILLHCNSIAVVTETHGPETLMNNGAPAKLNAGQVIGPSGSWDRGGTLTSTFSEGNWQTDANDKYLGFRMKENFTSPDWRYGWIKLSVAGDASSFTIKEWAYNQAPNQPIDAGEKSNTTAINPTSKEPGISLQLQGRKALIKATQQGALYKTSMTDIHGRNLAVATPARSGEIDLSGLAPGLYILTVQSGDQRTAFKLSIQ